MKRMIFWTVLASGAALLASQAQAATIVLNNGAPYAEVVHAASAGSGTLLHLRTQPSNILVNLSSSDGLDAGAGNGVAIVKGLGVGQGNGFGSILVDPTVGFSVMQFKIEDFEGRNAGDNFDIRVNFIGGGFQNFLNFHLPNNDKIDIFAGPGEVMDSIFLSGLVQANSVGVNFKDIKQISFRAVPRAPAVPEPATWAMMISGFAMIGSILRRRSAKPVIATAA
jgi:PEP-CTERM motif